MGNFRSIRNLKTTAHYVAIIEEVIEDLIEWLPFLNIVNKSVKLAVQFVKNEAALVLKVLFYMWLCYRSYCRALLTLDHLKRMDSILKANGVIHIKPCVINRLSSKIRAAGEDTSTYRIPESVVPSSTNWLLTFGGVRCFWKWRKIFGEKMSAKSVSKSKRDA